MDGMDVVGESVMSIEALFLLLSDGGGDGGGAKAVRANLGPLRECLQCVVRLCRVQPEACDQFVDIIGGLLLQTGESMEYFDQVKYSILVGSPVHLPCSPSDIKCQLERDINIKILI